MITFCTYLATRYNYTREMPRTPDVKDGRTILINGFYDKTVYVNRREYNRLRAINYACWLSGGILFLFGFIYERKKYLK